MDNVHRKYPYYFSWTTQSVQRYECSCVANRGSVIAIQPSYLWDTVGLLAVNSHSKTYIALSIRVLKSYSVVLHNLRFKYRITVRSAFAWYKAHADGSTVAGAVQSKVTRDDGRFQPQRQAAVRSLGVMVMLMVKRRYSLLICRENLIPFWWDQTNYSFSMCQSWLSLVDVLDLVILFFVCILLVLSVEWMICNKPNPNLRADTCAKRKSTFLGLYSHSCVNRIAGLSNRHLKR
jgi:hypothetical protein